MLPGSAVCLFVGIKLQAQEPNIFLSFLKIIGLCGGYLALFILGLQVYHLLVLSVQLGELLVFSYV